ncbi:S9 family peptidase [Treponema sp. Marseille-Q4132]|uniref:alpha/beta hydrolase family protein n=1 Tax=Treponema sp. Marseille-Q4132 TaxID=2766701 RepID=UPI0016533DF0|nr:alpha/beta fold hydrolase [Treponema sp. Marseille-Q4132]QNL98066.1 alpha/beta hydrolase [Treponema sp. Marseille-Q4132]
MKKPFCLLTLLLCIGGIEKTAATQTGVPTAFTVQERSFLKNGMKIYGELFIPDRASPVPLAILSHGFGGNRGSVKGYAESFAERGIAAYIFEFIGGGDHIKSDGKMTEMSVLTEAEDLIVIFDNLKADSRFKAEQIFLFGESQGGFVSTYVAAKRPADVAGLVLLYPAFVLHDYVRRRTPDPERIPDTMKLLGKTVGRIYNKDVLSFDIYTLMPQYSGKTLIIHGSDDPLVPLQYSERAIKTFPDAKLIKLDGEKHVFYGNAMQKAAEDAVEFVQSIIGENAAAQTGTPTAVKVKE